MSDGNVSMNVTWDIKNLSCYWLDKDFTLISPVFKSFSNYWLMKLKILRTADEDTITAHVSRVNSDPHLSLRCSLDLASSVPPEGPDEQIELRGGGYFYSKTLVKGKFVQWKESVLVDDVLTIRLRLWSRKEPRKTTHSISTVIGLERLSFDWVVPHFATLPPNTKVFKRLPSLSLALSHENDIVRIEGNPEGNRERTHAKFEVSIPSAEVTYLKVVERTFPQATAHQAAVLFPDFISRSTLLASDCLPGGALTLHCTCFLSSGVASEQVTHNPKSFGQTLSGKSVASSLQSDMRKMYEDRICSDWEIRLENGEGFPVHRNVLFARAPYLKVLFGADCFTKSVALPDLGPDTLRRLLLFLYTDEVDDMDYSSAVKLYLVSDKYLIQTLKQKCLDLMQVTPTTSEILELSSSTGDAELRALTYSHLKGQMNEGTACDILCSSAVDPRLLGLAKDYVRQNDAEVLTSQQWSRVMKRKPEVAAETLYDICIKRIKVEEKVEVKTEPLD